MADDYFERNPGRALTPKKSRQDVARTPSVQVRLAGISDAIPGPLRAVSRHSLRVCAIFAAVLLVLTVGAYIRLLGGPISFGFLVPTIQAQLNEQLRGYRFHVGDAILRLSSGWGLEFRLANVSVVDESGQELAKAPFAAVDVSEASLLTLSPAATGINLLGPKVLVFSAPGKGLTLTASLDQASEPADTEAVPQPWQAGEINARIPPSSRPTVKERPEAARARELARRLPPSSPAGQQFNIAPLLARLFTALENRGGASSALRRVGMRNATIYFANGGGVSAWRVADFHIDLEERSSQSDLKGELTLQQADAPWRISFRAVNRPQEKLYSLTASVQDVVPRTIWRSLPSVEALKLLDLPVSGVAHFDLSHEGVLVGGDTTIEFGSGQLFAPFDDKHPASIDSGILRVAYDKKTDAVTVSPFELRWDESILTIAGSIVHRIDPRTNDSAWVVDLSGKGSKLGALQFGVAAARLDTLRLTGTYKEASDSITLNEFRVRSGDAQIALAGEASNVTSGGAIRANGTVSPMPLSFLKAVWPAFVANGARDWIGSNIPSGRISGGSFSANLSGAVLASLRDGGDVPDSAVSMRLDLSGMQVYHIKGLPPIETKETTARVIGRRFVFDIPGDARIEVPSGRAIAFSDAQFLVDDLRPHFPSAEIRFKAQGEATGAMELLDQPPLGYVKAVGFKPDIINGQVVTTFKITLPLLKELHFKQLGLSGKTRVSDLKSNGLPGGLVVNGGTINFDVSETAIGANGEVKVNNVPVSLAWQRIFDAPPERQPTLRAAAILNEKARDELGLNVNHIIKGDLPIALAVAMQRDGPPKLFMEANLTNSDLYLTAIGWRKPPGHKAVVTFDIAQRHDNFIVLDNFAMIGDGINISGRLLFNERRRIAGFNFPEFSTNALTKLSITGELTPQNILKVQAKGPSFDGRQFFRSLLSAGKISDNQPAPLKDEPGLDLNVEMDTVFGYYDTTVKSVVVDAKRRSGKLTALEISGSLNGEAPVGVHVEQKGDARHLISEATDAGSAFRLVGFYPAVHGGRMTLRVNLDGSGSAEKIGMLDVSKFVIVADSVVGKVVSRAEQEGARVKPASRNVGQAAASGEPLQFEHMWARFSVGSGQFYLSDAAINGPLIGATLRGRIDFAHDTIGLSGTYVPLFGLNAVLGVVPLLGDLLTGRQGEGMFGITFAVQGRTSNPDVLVNPASIVAPGFLRQIFEFDNSTAPPPAQQSAPATQARSQPRSRDY
jgi:hypothetical protein